VSFVLIAARKDLQRRRRDPVAFLLWAGIPLVIASLIFLAFGGEDAGPSGRLLVADSDDSLLSNLLAGSFEQGPLGDIFEVEEVEEARGRARMDDGEASGLLIIPEGFGQAVLDGEPMELTLVRNPAQRIVPGILEESLSMVVEATFYLQELLGEPLEVLAGGPPGDEEFFPDTTISSVSTSFNQIAQRVEPYLFPPAVVLETTLPEGEEADFDFGLLFLPTMLGLALLFMAQGLSEDVWQERSQGTLRRVVTTPRSVASFLTGKLLAGAALIGAVMVIGLAAGRWLFGIELNNLPLGMAWATLSGVGLLALMTLVQLFAGSERTGNILTGAAVFPLAMLGGSFFPFELMPGWMAAAGRFVPNGWAMIRLNAIMQDRIVLADLAVSAVVAVAVTGLLVWLSVLRLRRSFAAK
jgi:ABC-2 type transport system permease protein